MRIILTFLPFLIFAGLTGCGINSDNKTSANIIVYAENYLSDDRIQQITETLTNSEYTFVGGVVFMSSEEAWENFKRDNSEFIEIYERIDYNPLPNIFTVTINDSTKADAAVQEFEEISGVIQVVAPPDAFGESLFNFLSEVINR